MVETHESLSNDMILYREIDIKLCQRYWVFATTSAFLNPISLDSNVVETMNSVRSNNISLKYQRFTTLGSKEIGIINSEFVTTTQFLYKKIIYIKFCTKIVGRIV